MSGGVDSAVAAARAAAAGHEVTGVHLALSRNPQSFRTGARGCCTIEDSRDARRAADVIGIPFYVWDMAERFHADVVDDFVAEYAAGRTPNPCLRCNEKIKFAAVLDKARALGFDAVCTGHYARIVERPDGGRELHRAADPDKDQSYVLGVLDAEQLAGAMFPLGDSLKAEVRAEAERRGLAVADKPDSHDVCFIADGDTRGFLAERLGTAPGRIVDSSGAVLGEHQGAYGYTIGQRKGLRIGDPAGDGRPRYVLDISPVTNTVTVGTAEELGGRRPRGRPRALVRPARRLGLRLPRTAARARRAGRGARGVRRGGRTGEPVLRRVGARDRPRADRSALRRHPRHRLGDHHRDAPPRRTARRGLSQVRRSPAARGRRGTRPRPRHRSAG